MGYVEQADIEDELLKTSMQPTDFAAADSYVNSLAIRLGIDPKRIPTDPIPDAVKRLAVATACERRAKMKAGTQPAQMRGANGEDIYMAKRRVYAAEMKELTDNMTIVDMLGAQPALPEDNSSPFSIEIARG